MCCMPKKLTKTVTKRLVRKWLRRLSVRAQVIILIALGFILGVIAEYALLRCLSSLRPAPAATAAPQQPPPPRSLASVRIATNDRFDDAHGLSYAFFFGSGRSGTQHLSRVLVSRGRPVSFVTHEQEDAAERTKDIVFREYRALAAQHPEARFHAAALAYVRGTKVPRLRRLLRAHGARRLLYTGHVPMAFGLAPALVRALPAGRVRIVRVRRERVATAVSLMALGPEEEDPWGASSRNVSGWDVADATLNSRWFPRPTDAFVRLGVSTEAWGRLNRFQRWLWYVDDMECRWQALVHELGSRFSWMEENLESLSILDGGRSWSRIAQFVGAEVDWAKVGVRDNSIEVKQRAKIRVAESQLREWDMQYRKVVGECRISSEMLYGWGEYAIGKL